MSLTIKLPERIENHLQAEWGNEFPQKAIEALAVEGYRTGALSLGEVAEMLDMSINDADGFLKARGVSLPLTLEDYETDGKALDDLLSK